MAPTMRVSALLAGGLKNAIVPCVATKSLRMRCASVACSPGVAISSRQRTEQLCQGSNSKQELSRILMAPSCLTSGYQLSNVHLVRIFYARRYTHPWYFKVQADKSRDKPVQSKKL